MAELSDFETPPATKTKYGKWSRLNPKNVITVRAASERRLLNERAKARPTRDGTWGLKRTGTPLNAN